MVPDINHDPGVKLWLVSCKANVISPVFSLSCSELGYSKPFWLFSRLKWRNEWELWDKSLG